MTEKTIEKINKEAFINTALFTFKKENSLNFNWFEENCYYFIGVVSGTLTLKTKNIGEENEYVMYPGFYGMFEPNTILKNIKHENCTLRVICVHSNLMDSCCKFLSKSASECIYNENFPIFFNINLENMYCVENCCEQYTNCSHPEWQINMSKTLITLLITFMLFPKNDIFSKYPPIVKKILSILNVVPNIINGIPQSVYELGYSKSYICRIFKKNVGMSITQYITDMKLKHSITIFNHMNVSIAEVCESLHIESIPYFTKIFKKKFGITPAKYRDSISR